VPHGGWFPLVIAGLVFTLMTTWKRGRQLLAKRLEGVGLPVDLLIEEVRRSPPVRVPGTAVFMQGVADGTPVSLLHNIKHNHVLHERVVFLTIVNEDVPYVQPGRRLTIEVLDADLFRVLARYGFAETPDINVLLESGAAEGLPFRMAQTTFFLSRETLVFTDRPGLAGWRKRLFARMQRNALRATAYFGLPPNRVVELGTQIEF
jgi:KUP system potassium uptake protein